MIDLHSKYRQIALPVFLFFVALGVSCGSSGHGDRADSGNSVESGGAQATATAVLDVANTSGITWDEPIIDGGQFGGKVTIRVKNESGELCSGLSVNLNLLTADGTLVSNVAMITDRGIEPGDEVTITNRYIGAGAEQTRLSAITCDNTGASHGAPQSPTK